VLYRVEDNRLVVLEAESYVDDILDWEKRATGARARGYFPSLLVSHLPSFDVED